MVEADYSFSDLPKAQDTVLKAIAGASRNIQLYASLVDPALFNSEATVAALSHFARNSRVASLRILVEDHKLFAIRNPFVLALAHRLSGHIEIRSVPFEIRNSNDCYLVSDQRSLWYIPDCDVVSGSYHEGDRVKAQKYFELFQYCWERSKQPEDFRRLAF